MSHLTQSTDWDPRDPEILADQIAGYDQIRAQCPVALDPQGHWSFLRHGDVVRALVDHETFSSNVSVHVAVPNGMDPPEHTSYRAVIDRYYTPERMTALEPTVRAIAIDLIDGLNRAEPVEVMSAFAEPFAIAVQNAFMGWSDELAAPLMAWNKKNHEAVLSQDRDKISAVAMEFDGYIREQLTLREAGSIDDLTSELLNDEVDGRRLTQGEIVAIIRNWTVGELGTMAASFGIILEFLASHPRVQEQLREAPHLAEQASDEILRIHPPLIANRRRAAHDVQVADRTISAEDRVNIVWASANRDESVFGDPDQFRLDRDPELNLLYGRGIHACPGAPLARLEFRVFLEEFLARTQSITIAPGTVMKRAIFPASGWESVSLILN